MFRLLEDLVDPFVDRGVPLSGVSVAATVASVCLELALFVYAARLVDMLVTQPRATLWVAVRLPAIQSCSIN